jgi:hypothetical protein
VLAELRGILAAQPEAKPQLSSKPEPQGSRAAKAEGRGDETLPSLRQRR